MNNKYRLLFFTAIAGGMYLSVFYTAPVEPPGRTIMLSEMILELSGSRGMVGMGFSSYELISFAMRLFPAFIFVLYAGIMLYRHFCTASVYVFSRYPHRMKWYIGEVCHLGGAVCIFHVLLLTASIITTMSRYELRIDREGMVLAAYYFFIYSLWVYIMALSINLLAVYLGSSTGYTLVISVQMVCIVLLNLTDLLVRYFDDRLTYENFLIWNPIAHLVFEWHNGNMEILDRILTSSSYLHTDLNHSLMMFLLLGIIVTSVGAGIIKNHNLLVADLETEAA